MTRTEPQEVLPLRDFVPSFFADPTEGFEQSLSRCNAAFEKYTLWLEGLDESLLQVRTCGGWSAVQHADHLARTNRLLARGLERLRRGETPEVIPLGFQRRDGRLLCPPGCVPVETPAREDVLTDLQVTQWQLEDEAQEMHRRGLGQVRAVHTGLFAPMTALECLQLTAVHHPHHMRVGRSW